MEVELLMNFLDSQRKDGKKYPYSLSTLISSDLDELNQYIKMLSLIYIQVKDNWDGLDTEARVLISFYFYCLTRNTSLLETIKGVWKGVVLEIQLGTVGKRKVTEINRLTLQTVDILNTKIEYNVLFNHCEKE